MENYPKHEQNVEAFQESSANLIYQLRGTSGTGTSKGFISQRILYLWTLI